MRKLFSLPKYTAPSGYTATRKIWGGIDKRQGIDTGMLSDAVGVDCEMLPLLAPSQMPLRVAEYDDIITVCGIADLMCVVFREDGDIKLDVIKGGERFCGILCENADDGDDRPRTLLQFNVYSDTSDPLGGVYTRKILIFPDAKSIPFELDGDFTPTDIFDPESGMPSITTGVVHLSRLFGTDGDRVYASGFNDYTAWQLDTADESLPSNAWCSATQSNTRADGTVTAMTVYDGQVVLFKRDFMQLIYNTSNPFRIVDAAECGALSPRAVTVCGSALYFVSEGGVMRYGGGVPTVISEPLCAESYEGAVLASRGGVLYCFLPCDGCIYCYSVSRGEWGSVALDGVRDITRCDGSVYAATESGIYRLDSGVRMGFEAESDIIANSLPEPRRIRRLSLFAQLGCGESEFTDALFGRTVTVTAAGDVTVTVGGVAGIPTETTEASTVTAEASTATAEASTGTTETSTEATETSTATAETSTATAKSSITVAFRRSDGSVHEIATCFSKAEGGEVARNLNFSLGQSASDCHSIIIRTKGDVRIGAMRIEGNVQRG